MPRPDLQALNFTLLEKYRLERPLGHGISGDVFLAREEGSPTQLAVKIMRITPLEPDDPRRKSQVAENLEIQDQASPLPPPITPKERFANLEEISREVRWARRLSHPYIVSHVEAVSFTNATIHVTEACVMNLTKAGAMRCLAPEHILSLYQQVGEALVYIERQNAAHLDIKPDNIFVAVGEDGAITARVGDFGLASDIDEHQQNGQLRRPVVTSPWRAVNLFKEFLPEPKSYRNADAFAFLCAILGSILQTLGHTVYPSPFPQLFPTARLAFGDKDVFAMMMRCRTTPASIVSLARSWKIDPEYQNFFLRHCGDFTTQSVSPITAILSDRIFARARTPTRTTLRLQCDPFGNVIRN